MSETDKEIAKILVAYQESQITFGDMACQLKVLIAEEIADINSECIRLYIAEYKDRVQ